MALRPGNLNLKGPKIGTIRTLTREDLPKLLEKRDVKPIIQRLRDPHHMLARLIAAGLTQTEAGEQAGYSYNRVSSLMKDPGFRNLVAEYRAQVNASFLESTDAFMTLATGNMLKAERQLAEKLEIADEEGELLPTRDLIAISADRADRFGYGKKTTNLNVNVDFAAQLEKAIARSGKGPEMKVVSDTSSRLPPPSGAGVFVPPTSPPQPIRRRA